MSILFCGLILCGCGEESKFIEEVKTAAESQGLKDVSVTAKEDSFGYGLFEATVTCSNFDEFTPKEMLSIVDNIEETISGGIVMDYVCNGDKYVVSPSTNHITKNGDYDWYNDYKNSEVNAWASSNISSGKEKMYDVTDQDEKVTCWILAQSAVKNKLKSPSTAKFPFSASSDGVSISKNSKGDTYYVLAWVEAENSFGATLKSDFCVTLSYDGSDFIVISTIIDE